MSITKTAEATAQVKIPGWEPVIPFNDIQTPEISAKYLPGWAGQYAHEVSRCASTPEGFAVMLTFATLAACTQKRFCVSSYGDSYTEPVGLWVAGVMPPGSRKTFVHEALTRPIVEWELQQAQVLKGQIDHAENARAILNKRIDRLQNEAAKEHDAIQRTVIIHEIDQIREAMPDSVRAPRLFTNDCTAERFQSLLVEHGERMAVISDEGGIFEVMAGLYTGGQVNMDVFLKSHAGSPVRVDRNTREAYLHQPLSTFGLAVQPAIIEDLAHGSKKKFRGNGCLARFLYCVPPSNVGSRDLTQRHVISDTVQAGYTAGIQSLLAIRPQFNESGVEYPRVLKLDQPGQHSWIAYLQALESRMAETGDLAMIADWTAKLPGAVLRLAALSHIAEHGSESLVIARTTIEDTLELADKLIKHALCAFSLMGSDPVTADAKYVSRWIRKNGKSPISQNDIQRGCHGKIPRIERLQKALAVLIERHIISDAIVEKTGGRPSIQFNVNPLFLGGDQ